MEGWELGDRGREERLTWRSFAGIKWSGFELKRKVVETWTAGETSVVRLRWSSPWIARVEA